MNQHSHSLPGVSCEVTTCVYNSKDLTCQAEHITVENQARESVFETDTFCGTFVSK